MERIRTTLLAAAALVLAPAAWASTAPPRLVLAEIHIAAPKIAAWSPLGHLPQIDDGRLAELRGGFTTTSGLQISFGIERAIYVNGDLVATTNLNVTAGLGAAITANAQQRVASAIAETPLATAPTTTATAPAATASAATASAAGAPAPAAPVAAAPTTTATPTTLLSNSNVSLQSAANGGVVVVQNGAGNLFQASSLDPAAIGTVIQNSLDNQNIKNITMINASVNSMDVLKAQQMRETLNSAIIDSLRR